MSFGTWGGKWLKTGGIFLFDLWVLFTVLEAEPENRIVRDLLTALKQRAQLEAKQLEVEEDDEEDDEDDEEEDDEEEETSEEEEQDEEVEETNTNNESK